MKGSRHCVCFHIAPLILVSMAIDGCGCGDITLSGDAGLDQLVVDHSGDDAVIDDQDGFEEEEPHVFAWAKLYGGLDRRREIGNFVQQTTDGGYIIAGTNDTSSMDGSDGWIVRLDEEGNVMWHKKYEGCRNATGVIRQTGDGGYVAAGTVLSCGAGLSDFLVLKLDENGNVQWGKSYGDADEQYGISFLQTSDGGYILAGFSNPFEVLPCDYLIIKLDETGNVEWQKKYSGGELGFYMGFQGPLPIQRTLEGGYIIAGTTYYNFPSDFRLLKLDPGGNVLWQSTYDSGGRDFTSAIQRASDGGFVVAGSSGADGSNLASCVFKLDDSGLVEWAKTYSGEGNNYPRLIQQTSDSGYIMIGFEALMDDYNFPIWLVKLGDGGEETWKRTYGSENISVPSIGNFNNSSSVQPTSDGGYIVAGATRSFYSPYSSDMWVIKVDASGSISETCPPYIGVEAGTIVTPISLDRTETHISPEPCNVTVTVTDIVAVDADIIVETQCSR